MSLNRAPLEARRDAIPTPLIPLQIAPKGRLQHELSHYTETSPDQTISLSLATTEIPRIQLRRRQNVITTVTNVDVVVVDGNGRTVATTVLTAVPTGSLGITLPFTTVTVPPLAGITGIIPLSSTTLAAAPIFNPPSQVTGTPIQTPAVSPVPIPAPSTRVPSISSQEIPSSRLSTSGIPTPALSGTGNNNFGSPGVPSKTSSLNPKSSVLISTITTQPVLTPTTLGTLTSSNSLSGNTTSITSASSIRSSASNTTTESIGLMTNGPLTPTITAQPPATTSTEAAATGGASPVNVPVVGGVIGGLGGLALLLIIVLLLFKWWRRRQSSSMALRSVDDENYPPGTSNSKAPMAQNSAAVGVGAAAGVAGIGTMLKRVTGGSTATTETVPSERGFQNFGGRKLESVLASGGDGLRERGRSNANTPTSFSRGWVERFPYDTPSKHSSMIVGPSTPYKRQSGTAELPGSPIGRPDGDIVEMMPGPARAATFTTPARSINPPSKEASGLPPPQSWSRPRFLSDPHGRNRDSQDGSRGSKFTEDL